MKTQFDKWTKWTLHDFNMVMGTDIKETDTFSEAVDKIEEEEVQYFYISMNANDVLEAIENEKEIAKQLGLNLIYIDGIGIYIATY